MNESIRPIEQGKEVLDLGDGIRGWEWIDVEVSLPDQPEVAVVARVEWTGRRYEVTRLSLDGKGEAITAEALRAVPLRTVARDAARHMVANLSLRMVLYPSAGEDRGPNGALLRNVARWYGIARVIGDAPTIEVAKRLGNVSRATASRRIAEARAAGYLGPEVAHAGGPRSKLGGG